MVNLRRLSLDPWRRRPDHDSLAKDRRLSVTHHVELMLLLGISTLMRCLGQRRCAAAATWDARDCFADLDNNGFVGPQTVLMLTLFGATCE